MSEIKYAQAGRLKPGSFILIDDVPCKVTRVDISKPGKHGSAKARIEAKGVFDGKTRGDLFSTSDDVKAPVMDKVIAQVLADMGESWQLMDMENYETFEVPKPSDVEGIEPGKEVELTKWGASMRIIKVRA